MPHAFFSLDVLECDNHRHPNPLLITMRMKNNKFRNARNVKPANLDLFLQLDAALANEEMKGAKIGFWHVPREYNSMSDTLAKQAAPLGDPD